MVGVRSFFTGALIPCLAWGIATPAHAATDSGATVFSQSYCNPLDDVHEYCEKAHGVFHQVETRSGNLNVIGSQRRTYTFTENGVVVASGESSGTFKFSLRAGETHVVHGSSATFDDYYGLVCTSSTRFHEVDGRVVYDDSVDMACTLS